MKREREKKKKEEEEKKKRKEEIQKTKRVCISITFHFLSLQVWMQKARKKRTEKQARKVDSKTSIFHRRKHKRNSSTRISILHLYLVFLCNSPEQ